jgi:hypothetical protein
MFENQFRPEDSISLETLTALLYRMAAYASQNLIDDAAILALIFC